MTSTVIRHKPYNATPRADPDTVSTSRPDIDPAQLAPKLMKFLEDRGNVSSEIVSNKLDRYNLQNGNKREYSRCDIQLKLNGNPAGMLGHYKLTGPQGTYRFIRYTVNSQTTDADFLSILRTTSILPETFTLEYHETGSGRRYRKDLFRQIIFP